MAGENRQGRGSRSPRRANGINRQQLRRTLIALGMALVFILAMTLLEKLTGEPVWDEFYQMFGLQGTAGTAGSPAAQGETSIHFIDIGQGDAVLIEQDGEFCLIDAGLRDTQDQLIAYLQKAGATELKLLVMTHPHADHIGGMREVLRECRVQAVLLPDFDKAPLSTSRSLARILEEIDAQGISTYTVHAGDAYPIGTGSLQVLADGVETENYNDLSPVLRFVGAGLTFVDSGDGERAVERDVLARGAELSADVYKAAHHGSNTSNTADFLEAMRPRIVVASCGLDNEYGHPHREPRQRFSEIGAEFYRTDQDGSVVVTGGPEGVRVTTAKDGERLRDAA